MLEKVPNVVATCVILHIICEMFGDHFQSEWELHEEQDAGSHIRSLQPNWSTPLAPFHQAWIYMVGKKHSG